MKYHRITNMPILLLFIISLLIAKAGAQEKVDVDAMPVAKTKVTPTYPEEAKKAGTEGTVYVQALIDEKGMVAKVEISKSDAKVLNGAAMDAIQKWTFAPAMKDKKPVSVWVTIPVKFKLQKDEKGVKK